MIVKKHWSCLSCDKNMDKYQGKLGEIKFTSVFPTRFDSPRIGGNHRLIQAITSRTKATKTTKNCSWASKTSKKIAHLETEMSYLLLRLIEHEYNLNFQIQYTLFLIFKMTSGLHLLSPIFVFNLAGEMMYILNQRLKAQNIPSEKGMMLLIQPRKYLLTLEGQSTKMTLLLRS